MTYDVPALTIGHGKPHIAFVTGIHGDENIYTELISFFQKISLLKGKVSLILANPAAAKENTRFIEKDLNRCFPGKPDGKSEEKLAFALTKAYKGVDCLIDFHSFHFPSAPFTVLTGTSKAELKLAEVIGLKENVIMPGRGVSFVEQVKLGIGVELGIVGDVKRVRRAHRIIRNVLSEYQLISSPGPRRVAQRYLIASEKTVVSAAFKPSPQIKNFKRVKKGDLLGTDEGKEVVAAASFIPVLLLTKGYGQVLCRNGKRYTLKK